MIELNKIYNEDCLVGMKRIPDGFVDLIITSPPFAIFQWVYQKAKTCQGLNIAHSAAQKWRLSHE